MSTTAISGVVVDSWAAKSISRNVALVVGLTVLTALSAQVSIPLPFTPVPLTLQTFAVLAGAAALGAERAVLAQVLYITLAVAGLPVLAGGASGRAEVIGATGGYLLGFVVASYVVGRISAAGASTKTSTTLGGYSRAFTNYDSFFSRCFNRISNRCLNRIVNRCFNRSRFSFFNKVLLHHLLVNKKECCIFTMSPFSLL